MIKRKIILALTVLIFVLAGCAGNMEKTDVSGSEVMQLTQEEKLKDFEYMYTILEENYPYFEVNKRKNGIDWMSKKSEYISRIRATSDDEQFFNVLQEILSELNNGHTDMLGKSFYTYCRNVYEDSGDSRAAWLDVLTDPKAVQRYETMTTSGEELGLSLNNPAKDNVKTSILENNKTAYMSIDLFNYLGMDSDMKIIEPFLKSIKDYEKLIIDIRGNSGGSDSYWRQYLVPMLINSDVYDTKYIVYRGGSYMEPFFKCITGSGYEGFKDISNINNGSLTNMPPEVKQNFKYYSVNVRTYEPNNSVGFKGNIYLLIDKKVFSSSEGFAAFAKDTGFATLIGEATGGDGIGFDPIMCVLPNSGYIFRFPGEMGLSANGTCNFEHGTIPDIEVKTDKTPEIFEDEAVKTVLNLAD